MLSGSGDSLSTLDEGEGSLPSRLGQSLVYNQDEDLEDVPLDNASNPIFTVAETDENDFLTIEGVGVVEVVERRAELLRGLLWGLIEPCFRETSCSDQLLEARQCGPCLRCIDTFKNGPNVPDEEKKGRAITKRVWPRGFGPGWVMRTFSPIVLLVWSLVLYNGLMHGLDLFKHLNGAINSPDGSPSALAESAYLYGFKHAAAEDFVTNTVILIENKLGGSVLNEEIEQFSRTMQNALICPSSGVCVNELYELLSVVRYDGYYMRPDGFERRATKPVFVNANETKMMIYVRHSFQHGVGKGYFEFLEAFMASNGPNAAVYDVTFTNEQKMLQIAQDEVIYDFAHADLIGIPFAWVILLWYCGFPAFLVLISLPICILAAFSLSVLWMPDNLALPTFAPSMIVSMAVALNVDYALFMLVRYSEEINRGASRNFALDKAMSTAGKTIAVSGSIMLVSNGCLFFVKADTVAALGVSLAITNMLTIFTNITLLPALLAAFGASFDYIRAIEQPSLKGGLAKTAEIIMKIILFVIYPFRKGFRALFGTGRKQGRVKLLRGDEHDHVLILTEDDDDDQSVSPEGAGFDHGEDADSLILPLIAGGSDTGFSILRNPDDNAFAEGSDNLYAEQEDVMRSSSAPNREISNAAISHNASLNSLSVTSWAQESHASSGGHGQSSFVQHTALSTGSNAGSVGSQLYATADGGAGQGAFTSQALKRKSSSILSAQSRIWATIANLCLKYPRSLIFAIVAACIPVCAQMHRFGWTDSQANLVPARNLYVENVDRIGADGFVPGFLADYKGIVSSPVSKTSKLPLSRKYCFDNDAALQQLLEIARQLEPGIPPFSSVSCELVATLLPTCQLPEKLGKKYPMARNFIPNACPYSCDTCRSELISSAEFWRKLNEVGEILLKVTNRYATMDYVAAGGQENAIKGVIESPAFFLGRKMEWDDAKRILSARNASESDVEAFYREKFYTMVSLNGSLTATQALLRMRPSFHPFNEDAHPWVNDMRSSVSAAGYNDKEEDYRFFFGGGVVRLFDQVDQVYVDTPPVMITAVVLTVLGTSLLVFQSLLLGPRLLVTIALTIGLVFGIMVIIFQDLHGSPHSSGLYWIVPILGVPIMVGCTLDYDSFVVARIYEMRMAALSTEAAVFAGLQETGHVITIAGVIMTVAFGSMAVSTIPVVQQIGALLVACCLLDTFIIRSLLVPSLMLVAVERNWFPKKMPEVQITMALLREAAAAQKAKRRKRKEQKRREKEARMQQQAQR